MLDRSTCKAVERILVALDDSPLATTVLAESIALAWALGGRLRLFRSVPAQLQVVADVGWSDVGPYDLERHMMAEARADLERKARHISPCHFDSVEVVAGKAWTAICAASERWGANLIVMGADGHHLLDRVLGSTASKVVNHTTCSVMIVRMRLERAVEPAVAMAKSGSRA
jgi:nucleotide-binding universal stress UspA family protein